MFLRLRRFLPLIILPILIIYDHRISIPFCKVVPTADYEEGHISGRDHPDDLKVMMVANLLLQGSEAGLTNVFFRDYHLGKFFRKSYQVLKPDMLLVLGDVSARGSGLSRSKWSSVLLQFHRVLGPFGGLPFHVTVGDRDIGECSELNARSVNWIASSFPGLDSAGCGAFKMSNISFVSLNAVALLCGNNKLRPSVEKAIERESIELRMESELKTELLNESNKIRLPSGEFGWRENAMSSGSGPVLLVHFPLHQMTNNKYGQANAYERTSKSSHKSSKTSKSRELVGPGPYALSHTLPLNATEYVFQALRPRIVFSAHTHKFCDRTHSDGTREITVPAMSWNGRDDPGFVVANFRRNGREITVSHCSLTRESYALIAYISVFVVIISIMIVANT